MNQTNQNNQTNPLKFIGLIGLGYWGKNILRNLYELGAIRSACDNNPETISERKGKFPGLNYTASFGEMLSDKEIRAVAIATPAITHHQLVKLALLAGKDVFVEKPLALTVKEGRELVELFNLVSNVPSANYDLRTR